MNILKQLDQTALALSANSFAMTMIQSTFMFYYVKVFLTLYQVPAEWFQASQVVYMIWNALNDPLFGYMIDHCPMSLTRTRRHTILYGAPIYVLSFLLPWFPWTSEKGTWIVGLHLMISLCFYDTMFTSLGLTAAALNTEISTNHQDRLRNTKYASVTALCGSFCVLFIEFLSKDLKYFHLFQLGCVGIGIISWIAMTYTGKYCHTEFELNQLSSVQHYKQVVHTDRSTEYSFWHLTWQLITQRNFITYVTCNFLSEFHRAYFVNFASIFYEKLVPSSVVPWFIRSAFYGWLMVLPQVKITPLTQLCLIHASVTF